MSADAKKPTPPYTRPLGAIIFQSADEWLELYRST